MRATFIAAMAMSMTLVLGGCITDLAPAPPAVATCDAAGAAFAIGQVASPATVEAARQGSGAAIVRTIRPGQMVTMEFSADRLNLDVNNANVITSARCG